MKYNNTNAPLVCMQKNSTCYKGTGTMTIRGVLWHSTGANNPTIKRYVQPYETDPDYAEMVALIGKNPNGNDWNHIYHQAGLNAWIGELADGSISTVQTMPWNYKPWGCGGGCNNGWIQFEICEDSLSDADYFNAVYKEACELTAFLCATYGLDPTGYVSYSGKTIPVILCHADSYDLGMGSNHGDIYHWFNRYGKTMDNVRQDVANIIAGMNTDTEDEDMDVVRFKELWTEMRKDLQDNDSGTYSAEARVWATNTGLIAGNGTTVDGQPNCMWEDMLTREQFVTVLYRFAKTTGMA